MSNTSPKNSSTVSEIAPAGWLLLPVVPLVEMVEDEGVVDPFMEGLVVKMDMAMVALIGLVVGLVVGFVVGLVVGVVVGLVVGLVIGVVVVGLVVVVVGGTSTPCFGAAVVTDSLGLVVVCCRTGDTDPGTASFGWPFLIDLLVSVEFGWMAGMM